MLFFDYKVDGLVELEVDSQFCFSILVESSAAESVDDDEEKSVRSKVCHVDLLIEDH